MGCKPGPPNNTSTQKGVYIMTPSLEEWSIKAKDLPSLYEVRLILLKTHPSYQCLRDKSIFGYLGSFFDISFMSWILCNALQILDSCPSYASDFVFFSTGGSGYLINAHHLSWSEVKAHNDIISFKPFHSTINGVFFFLWYWVRIPLYGWIYPSLNTKTLIVHFLSTWSSYLIPSLCMKRWFAKSEEPYHLAAILLQLTGLLPCSLVLMVL